MAQAKILLYFTRYGDNKLQTFASGVLQNMSGNVVNFPNPTPSVQNLSDAFNNYSQALASAQSRDKAKIEAKRQIRKDLLVVMTALASYLNFTSGGRRELLATTGYELSSETRSRKQLGSISNFTVTMGANSGEVTLSMDSVTNAKGYSHAFAQSPVINDAWTHIMTSFPTHTFTGLTPLKEYCFRSMANGSKGQMVITAIITRAMS